MNKLATKEEALCSNRFLADFHIAGFKYYDGLEVFDQLHVGVELELALDTTNFYDPNAIKVLYQGVHLGYVPKEKNELIATLMLAGYIDIFSLRINQVSPDKNPEHQIRCTLKVIARDKVASFCPAVEAAEEPRPKRKYTRRASVEPKPKRKYTRRAKPVEPAVESVVPIEASEGEAAQ